MVASPSKWDCFSRERNGTKPSGRFVFLVTTESPAKLGKTRYILEETSFRLRRCQFFFAVYRVFCHHGNWGVPPSDVSGPMRDGGGRGFVFSSFFVISSGRGEWVGGVGWRGGLMDARFSSKTSCSSLTGEP